MQHGAEIVLMGPSGQVLINTAVAPSAGVPLSPAAQHELRRKRGPEGVVISGLHTVPYRRGHSFALQAPVKRENRIPYYLSMELSASRFQSLLQAQHLPENWIGVILDANGMVVARSAEAEKFVGCQARQKLVSRIKADSTGRHEGAMLDGRPTLALFSRAPNSEWSFVINVPYPEVCRTAIQAALFMATISLLLLGAALLAALRMAQKTVKPVEALRASAERLGRGEPVELELSDIKEMNDVMAAMAHASAQIRSSKTEMERRVEETVARAERSQQALLQAQKLESLGRLTGSIAHDFNNVLQTITSGLHLAQYSSKDARITSLLATCERAVDRAVELTRKLMAFGRVQDARMTTVDINKQMQETIPLLKGALPSNIDFQTQIDDKLWPVTLDKLQFEHALLNFTINARDAMPEGGSLTLKARNEIVEVPSEQLASGNYVRISVADTGSGMSSEVLSKALDPFFTTKGVGQGTGLGLPQAYGFAKQTEGALILHSELKQGTQAVLYLPAADQSIHAEQSTQVKPSPTKARSGGMLLFVEDDPLVRKAVQPALEACGIQVKIAENGEEAWKLLASFSKIDYVFSDIMMPGSINGIRLAELVHERYPKMRVVLATGYTDQRVSLPNVRTLAKPYDIARVVEALTRD